MEAERRQVTVLFADMVGFTSFSERSGEEAAFALMRSLWKLMAEAVREHGGVVQDFTGDAGFPTFRIAVISSFSRSSATTKSTVLQSIAISARTTTSAAPCCGCPRVDRRTREFLNGPPRSAIRNV